METTTACGALRASSYSLRAAVTFVLVFFASIRRVAAPQVHSHCGGDNYPNDEHNDQHDLFRPGHGVQKKLRIV